MAEVRSKLSRGTVSDPLERTSDPFADFREVLRLDLKQSVHYRHSLGKASRFFLALEEGKLLATGCPTCGKVWLPPRPICPSDLSVTAWTELTGRGTLVSWTETPRAPRYADTGSPYLLAYVALEGASTLFLHQLRSAQATTLEHGQAVKVVFSEKGVRHPLELFWFEPA